MGDLRLLGGPVLRLVWPRVCLRLRNAPLPDVLLQLPAEAQFNATVGPTTQHHRAALVDPKVPPRPAGKSRQSVLRGQRPARVRGSDPGQFRRKFRWCRFGQQTQLVDRESLQWPHGAGQVPPATTRRCGPGRAGLGPRFRDENQRRNGPEPATAAVRRLR